MSADQLPIERRRLADFTTDLRVIPLSLICIVIGVIGAYLALILPRIHQNAGGQTFRAKKGGRRRPLLFRGREEDQQKRDAS